MVHTKKMHHVVCPDGGCMMPVFEQDYASRRPPLWGEYTWSTIVMPPLQEDCYTYAVMTFFVLHPWAYALQAQTHTVTIKIRFDHHEKFLTNGEPIHKPSMPGIRNHDHSDIMTASSCSTTRHIRTGCMQNTLWFMIVILLPAIDVMTHGFSHCIRCHCGQKRTQNHCQKTNNGQHYTHATWMQCTQNTHLHSFLSCAMIGKNIHSIPHEMWHCWPAQCGKVHSF